MAKPSWTVVNFLKHFSVAAVPTSWIIGEHECMWRPYSHEKLTAAIKG